jgi:hypothetical protein
MQQPIANCQTERFCETAQRELFEKGRDCCRTRKLPWGVAKNGRMSKCQQNSQECLFAVDHK